MGFTKAVEKCLKYRYASFSGRASRSEYWFFVLFCFIVNLAGEIVAGIFGAFSPSLGNICYILVGLVGLALLIPSLAAAVRRLHDTNRSAWWLLLLLIPLVGAIILLIWLCMAGTLGPNRYGPMPNPGQQSR